MYIYQDSIIALEKLIEIWQPTMQYLFTYDAPMVKSSLKSSIRMVNVERVTGRVGRLFAVQIGKSRGKTELN